METICLVSKSMYSLLVFMKKDSCLHKKTSVGLLGILAAQATLAWDMS